MFSIANDCSFHLLGGLEMRTHAVWETQTFGIFGLLVLLWFLLSRPEFASEPTGKKSETQIANPIPGAKAERITGEAWEVTLIGLQLPEEVLGVSGDVVDRAWPISPSGDRWIVFLKERASGKSTGSEKGQAEALGSR